MMRVFEFLTLLTRIRGVEGSVPVGPVRRLQAHLRAFGLRWCLEERFQCFRPGGLGWMRSKVLRCGAAATWFQQGLFWVENRKRCLLLFDVLGLVHCPTIHTRMTFLWDHRTVLASFCLVRCFGWMLQSFPLLMCFRVVWVRLCNLG